MKLSILFTGLCLFYAVEIASTKYVDPIVFLHKYGYLSPQRSSSKDLNTAIKTFQVYAHLSVTGKLDDATRKQMAKPRCGVKDTGLALGSIWKKHNLNYKILSYPTTLRQNEVQRILANAFGIWSGSSPLTFNEVPPHQTSDLTIEFLRGNHGDEFPFDGPTGIMGHAFFPTDGRIHFDLDENFTDGTSSGTNLLWLAVHEIGHAIGLPHSKHHDSLMSPYFQPRHSRVAQLPQSDQNEVRMAYGAVVPPGSTCVDKMPKVCPGIKSNGHCVLYKANSKFWCEKTCNFCQ